MVNKYPALLKEILLKVESVQKASFYVFLGILGGLGAAMVGVIPAQSLVSRWFDKNLGTALSIAYACLLYTSDAADE